MHCWGLLGLESRRSGMAGVAVRVLHGAKQPNVRSAGAGVTMGLRKFSWRFTMALAVVGVVAYGYVYSRLPK